ncbi:protein DPCD [Sitophilus oryzae]|uniref:Protein DPCD n=1 Tax=Sitophilus oryzae TaxID=7048 RepID=A0A6J2Y360_SITOR|nr:protein DPCD [Sitophilus oryzae]
MSVDWFSQLQKARKKCIVQNNLKRIHFELDDNREMVEEYDLNTNVVTRRAWRINRQLKGENSWEIEIGDPEPSYDSDNKYIIRENSNQPFITRRNTRINLEWRIRNLPYPIEVYSVLVDKELSALIVQTTNKKYYKKIIVPDLQRLCIELEQENVSFSHRFNTLIITYKKPRRLIDFEKALLEEIKKIKPEDSEEILKNCKIS